MILQGLAAVLVMSSLVAAAPQNAISGRAPRVFSITDSMIDFTVDLSTNHLDRGNSVFSPLSITSLLNILLLGATDNTYNELRRAMKYPATADDFLIHQQSGGQLLKLQRPAEGVTVNIASRLFADKDFKIEKEYEAEVRDFYQASVEASDFASRPEIVLRRINSWVNDQTNGKISQLLSEPLPPFTEMVATNVVYFNSSWQTPFDETSTAITDFNVFGQEVVKTNLMSQKMDVPNGVFPNVGGGFQAVGLPYSGGEHAMFVFLPDSNTEAALDELERFLTSENLDAILARLQTSSLSVQLPRFKMQSSLSLRDALLKMGVRDLFSPASASLKRISKSSGQLYLDDVIHQAVIDVHERGTEAAAATAGIVSRGRFDEKFTANRPFLFVIQDNKTRVPLFWGRLVRPEDPAV